MTDKPKPQLHSSHLAMLYSCGIKFERIVLKGEKEPPGVALIVGSATHSTVAKNLNHKIETGSLLTREAVIDHAMDDFKNEWQCHPVILTPEEKDEGISRTKDHSQDETVDLAISHHYEIAPLIKPIKIERKWVLEADGYPFDLSGQMDVDEGTQIRDTKTKKVNTGARNVHFSEQYTFYAMAKSVIDGQVPEFVIEDALIKPTKTRNAQAFSYQSTRTPDDFVVAMRRFEQAIRIIEKEVFTPANPGSWDSPCHYCGFAADGSCRYFNTKRMNISFVAVKTKEKKDVQSLIGDLENCLEGT